MHHAADATGVDQVMITDSRPQPPVFRSLVQDTGAALAAPAGQSLFASMRQTGIDWPVPCRNGTCRTCIARPFGDIVIQRA